MPREITDHVAFLKEAKEALQQLEAWKAEQTNLAAEEKKAEKALTDERKIVADTVQSTIKKRREEIAGTYTQEIKGVQEQIKKEKAKRAKAKEAGVKNRMAEETAHLVAENTGLKVQLKELFKQSAAPNFCNSTLFYALYMPRGLKELLLLTVVVLGVVLVLPWLIWLLLPGRKVWMFFVLAVLFAVLALAAYLFVGNKVKVPYFTTLKEGRRVRNTILHNQNKIRKIKRGIRKDRDEEQYHLTEFDQALAGFDEEIQELKRKQEEALAVFDRETDPLIRKEIEDINGARLSELEQKLLQLRGQKKKADAEVKNRTMQCSDAYESYIGKEFMTKEKLDGLISVFETEAPANLAEAENIYRAQGQKKV